MIKSTRSKKEVQNLPKSLSLSCVQCNKDTLHNVETSCFYYETDGGHYTVPGDNEPTAEVWFGIYQITQCSACSAVSFLQTAFDPDSRQNILIEAHPNQMILNKNNEIARLLTFFPEPCHTAYKETWQAINFGNQPVLAGIGIRIILEQFCEHHNMQGKDLEEKINSLENSFGILRSDIETLHFIRKRGNDAAHKSRALTQIELRASLRVVDILAEKENAKSIVPHL